MYIQATHKHICMYMHVYFFTQIALHTSYFSATCIFNLIIDLEDLSQTIQTGLLFL